MTTKKTVKLNKYIFEIENVFSFNFHIPKYFKMYVRVKNTFPSYSSHYDSFIIIFILVYYMFPCCRQQIY